MLNIWLNRCQRFVKVSHFIASVGPVPICHIIMPLSPSCWMHILAEHTRSRKRNFWRTTASLSWPTSCTSTRAARGSSNASWRCCSAGRWAWRRSESRDTAQFKPYCPVQHRLSDSSQNTMHMIVCSMKMFLSSSVILSSLDLEEMENISPFRKRCIIPVLGLIENSLYENSLVHNILCMLLQLFNACPKLADILLDHGLLYVLFNTLSTLNGMENGYGC